VHSIRHIYDVSSRIQQLNCIGDSLHGHSFQLVNLHGSSFTASGVTCLESAKLVKYTCKVLKQDLP